MYEYQERLLLEHGFRVVTMDLPGFGRSDAPACGYSYDCLSDAVYAVVKSLGLCRFVLVGFSMGGAIVLRYMRRHRGYGVRKLALLQPQPQGLLVLRFSTWDGAIPSGSAYWRK